MKTLTKPTRTLASIAAVGLALLLAHITTGRTSERASVQASPAFEASIEKKLADFQGERIELDSAIIDEKGLAVLGLSLGLSACAGSACVISGCGGSACWASGCGGSGCGGSGCLGSGCGGSACGGSGCGGSGCGGSLCGGSACAGSTCAGSVCVGSSCVGSACSAGGCGDDPTS